MKQYGIPNKIIASTILRKYLFKIFSTVVSFSGLRSNTPVIMTNIGTHHSHKFLKTIQKYNSDSVTAVAKYLLIGVRT
jgi:hypothetical protein